MPWEIRAAPAEASSTLVVLLGLVYKLNGWGANVGAVSGAVSVENHLETKPIPLVRYEFRGY